MLTHIGTPAMAFKDFKIFSVLNCSHDFAFPRSTAEGVYSQVCRLCGAEYEYDWKEMRRKKRIDARRDKEAV